MRPHMDWIKTKRFGFGAVGNIGSMGTAHLVRRTALPSYLPPQPVKPGRLARNGASKTSCPASIQLNDGTIWTVGDDRFSAGIHGQGSTGETLISWTQIGTDTDWNFISMTRDTALAIKTDKTLYAWGRNTDNECGIATGALFSTPTLVDSPNSNYDWVAQGKERSYAIRSGGTLYACGDGQGTVFTQWSFTIFDWTKVIAAERGAMMLRANGWLYATGENSQLRWGDQFPNNLDVGIQRLEFDVVNPIENVLDMAFCYGEGAAVPASIFVRSDGKAFSVGQNSDGQCGHGQTFSDQWHEVTTQRTWLRCSGSSRATLLIDDQGDMYGSGQRNVAGLGAGAALSAHTFAVGNMNVIMDLPWVAPPVPDRSATLITSGNTQSWGVIITGAPDSLPDYALPVRTFTYRSTVDAPYQVGLRCVWTDEAYAALLARPNGEIVISENQNAVVTELARTLVLNIPREHTPGAKGMTVNAEGVYVAPAAAATFIISERTYRRITASSETWRFPPHPEILAGDDVQIGSDTMTVRSLNLFVDRNQAVMEATGPVVTV